MGENMRSETIKVVDWAKGDFYKLLTRAMYHSELPQARTSTGRKRPNSNTHKEKPLCGGAPMTVILWEKTDETLQTNSQNSIKTLRE